MVRNLSPISEKLLSELKKKYWNDTPKLLECIKRQYEIDQRYLRMARIWSENSYCVRRKVGALLVKDITIISDGYNGTPTGFSNVCEYVPSLRSYDECNEQTIRRAIEAGIETRTFQYVLHAEANAITKIAKSGNSSEGSTLYVTTLPCIECAKLIIQSGIVRVVYEDDYRLRDGIELLLQANIEVDRIDTKVKFEDTDFYYSYTK